MDHNSIIDKENFKVYLQAEDYPKAIICDKSLSKVIALLNKKGYKTFASCSGHYEITFYEYFDIDIKELSEYEKDPHVIIKDIRDNKFDCWEEKIKTYNYVLFDKKYDFEDLPDGFEYKISQNPITAIDRSCIGKYINYYRSDNNRKTRKEIEQEIDENCETLLKWAEKLPERKDDKK